MSITYTAPVAACLARLRQGGRSLESTCLDRCGTAEDALAEARWSFWLAQKAFDGIVLVNDSRAVETFGKAQAELARALKLIDSVLPRMPNSRDMTMAEAAPIVAPILADLPPLMLLVASLDPFVSPTGRMF